ncbi:hypothetical protein IU474_08660 [Nocardia otitidiscaviarum]|nr:hypothetical protein [Nocardia otitidiscaviarum]
MTGFDDPNVLRNPNTGQSIFEQFDPYGFDGAGGVVLPWRLGARASSAQNLADVDHTWQAQHLSVANGANDRWVSSHLLDMGAAVGNGNLRSGFTWTTYPERLQAAGIDWNRRGMSRLVSRVRTAVLEMP